MSTVCQLLLRRSLAACVCCAGLASYPIDTVRRRMMMTSGAAVKYNSSMHCMQEIIKNEGVKSLFKASATLYIVCCLVL